VNNVPFALVVIIIGIFLLINTVNGNIPRLIHWPGIHDASLEFNTVPITPQDMSNQQLHSTVKALG
jgi:hypothetical protein